MSASARTRSLSIINPSKSTTRPGMGLTVGGRVVSGARGVVQTVDELAVERQPETGLVLLVLRQRARPDDDRGDAAAAEHPCQSNSRRRGSELGGHLAHLFGDVEIAVCEHARGHLLPGGVRPDAAVS